MYSRNFVESTPVQGMPLYRSNTPGMGTWFWLMIPTADGGYGVFGNRTWESLSEARQFITERGL